MSIIFETQEQKLFYMSAMGETEIKIKNMQIVFEKYVQPLDQSIVVPAKEIQGFLITRARIAAQKAEKAKKKKEANKE